MAFYGTDYDKLLQAIASYYGSGSDQWTKVYNYYSLYSGDPVEVARILRQTPYVETTVSEAGEIVKYSIIEDGSVMSAAETAAAETAQTFNSNAVTNAVKELSIPSNAAVNETTGVMEMSSGATKMAGAATGSKAATVAGHVGTWVVGAAVGMKLGVWIDGTLYNFFPDFFDNSKVFQYTNPELWKDDKITNWLYDYSGYDDFVGMVDEEGQLYIDEHLMALMAQYLSNRGAFNANNLEIDIDDTSPLYNPTGWNFPVILSDFPVMLQGVNYAGEFNISVSSGNPKIALFAHYYRDAIAVEPFAFSDQPFTIHVEGMYGTHDYQATEQTKEGSETYYVWHQYGNFRNPYHYPANVFGDYTYNDNLSWDLAYIFEHGHVHDPSLPGVNPYGQVPQGITPEMTPDQIIALLKQQFPEIWNPTNPDDPSPLKQGVLQDDGTITDHVYIPVPTPDGGTEGQPQTTPQTPSKPDPDNETSTQTIVKIVQPTPNPVDQPDPDTGEGNTPVAPAPTGSADALYKIYNPTNAQIQSFGAWLWSSNFVDQLLKVFNDPMQAIISLHKIYAAPHTGGTADIKVGYLNSGVNSKWVDQQYIDVDCGSVNVFETSGNVIDYMSDIRIYLPFIGIVSLDVDDVMRGVVGVKYRIDVITGTCVAFVSITRDAGAGGVIYQYTGSMAEVYPLSSGSYMGIITGVLGIAAGIAGTIATGGAAAPALIGGAAGVSAMHTKVEHSNGFSGNAGALAAKKPYIIISRPQSAMSNGIGANTGWPANYYVRLSQCSGFTKAKTLHLSGISGATDTELQEIERLLKEGVII